MPTDDELKEQLHRTAKLQEEVIRRRGAVFNFIKWFALIALLLFAALYALGFIVSGGM